MADTEPEPNEGLALRLLDAEGATITRASAKAVVADDDGTFGDLRIAPIDTRFEAGAGETLTATGTFNVGLAQAKRTVLTITGTATIVPGERATFTDAAVRSTVGEGGGRELFEGAPAIPLDAPSGEDLTARRTAGETTFTLGGQATQASEVAIGANALTVRAPTITLPDSLGGIDLELGDVALTPSGVADVRLDTLARTGFRLFEIIPGVRFRDLAVDYNNPSDSLILQGDLAFALPPFSNGGDSDDDSPTAIAATLSTPDAELRDLDLSRANNVREALEGALIADSEGVDVIGDLKVAETPSIGGFGLTAATVSIDTVRSTVGGSAEVAFPWPGGPLAGAESGAGIGLGFTTDPFALNKIEASLDLPEPVPIDGTFFLTGVGGSVANLAEAESPSFGGDLDLILGPDDSLTPLKGTLSGRVAADMLAGDIEADLQEPTTDTTLGTLDAEATLNWVEGTFDADGTVSLLDGTIAGEVAVNAATQPTFRFEASSELSASVPATVPVIGGREVASAETLIRFKDEMGKENDFSNDFAMAWFDVFGIGQVGFKASLDPTSPPEFVGAESIPQTSSFEVAPEREFAFLQMQWESAVDRPVRAAVTRPDGTEITSDAFAADGMRFAAPFSSETRTTIAVEDPAPGIWDIRPVDASGLGTVSTRAFQNLDRAEVEVTRPAEPASGAPFTITVAATTPTATGSVALFYDTDGQGRDGTPITSGLQAGDGPVTFTWNPQNLPPGEYGIYARVLSGDSLPGFDYAEAPVVVGGGDGEDDDRAAADPNPPPGTPRTWWSWPVRPRRSPCRSPPTSAARPRPKPFAWRPAPT